MRSAAQSTQSRYNLVMGVIDPPSFPLQQEPPQPTAASRNRDVNSDLGFGSVVAREMRTRLLNRDGTFNARRSGLRFWESLSAYHYFLTITWGRFLSYVALSYVLSNALFAAMYVMCGDASLSGEVGSGTLAHFAHAFFFSVHTLATIGYGNVAPANLSANLVVTVESLVGLLGFALVAGIMFARFSRPVAKIRFSTHAVIAPYEGSTGFMFRIVNQKRSEIVGVEAKLLLTRRRCDGASDEREFFPLKLERDRVEFFPLSWTIVHPIDQSSPLRGVTQKELEDSDAEFLVLLNGFDETFSQTVHTRSSYKPEEVIWGAKFRSMFTPGEQAKRDIGIDVRLIDAVERSDFFAGRTV